jgi:hypothetical protein
MLAATTAAAARADGDPASDYLYTQKVFLPFDVKASPAKQKQLLATVQGAQDKGYVIRVAIISSAYDLGAVPSLYKKPATYARFLGAELGFVYKQRLLIMMPNGFGFYWKGHSAARPYSVLKGVHVQPGADGLVDGARAAVTALAADAGVKVQADDPKSSNNRDRLIVLLAVVVLIAAALLGRLALRRRR